MPRVLELVRESTSLAAEATRRFDLALEAQTAGAVASARILFEESRVLMGRASELQREVQSLLEGDRTDAAP